MQPSRYNKKAMILNLRFQPHIVTLYKIHPSTLPIVYNNNIVTTGEKTPQKQLTAPMKTILGGALKQIQSLIVYS